MNRARARPARSLVVALWLVVISAGISKAQHTRTSGTAAPGQSPVAAVDITRAAAAQPVGPPGQQPGTAVVATQLAGASVVDVLGHTPLLPVTAEQQPSLSVVGVYWQRTLTAAPAAMPAFDATHAYVALSDGTLVAVSVESGLIDWLATQQSTIGITAAAGSVVGASDQAIWARSGTTGQSRWQVTPGAQIAVGPAVVADTVVVATDAGEIIAVSLADGTPRWRARLDALVSTPIAVGEDTVFVGTPDGRVFALAAATGQRTWSRALRGRITALTALDNRVLAGSDNNFLYVLGSGNGAIAWMWRTGGDLVGSACADARHFYYVSMDMVLRAHNRKNGHLVWKSGLSTRPSAGPVLFGDYVAVPGVTPDVSLFATVDGQPATAVQIPSGIRHRPHRVPPAGASLDRLVLVTRLGEILAIGRSPEPELVPLAKPLGTELPAEALTPPREQPLVSVAALLGKRYAVAAASVDTEPPLVPLDVLLGSQIPPVTVPPGVEPPLVPLGQLPGRALPPETLPAPGNPRPPGRDRPSPGPAC